jgi:hypothetical protein
MNQRIKLHAPALDGQGEPELVERARKAIKANPGYVAHGPEVCPRDIIQAYELGRAEPVELFPSDASPLPVQDEPGPIRFFIRNPLRTVSAEVVERLGELATDLECGLAIQTSLVGDWTTAAERAELDAPDLLKRACERLAADFRAILGALQCQPTDPS